LVESHELPGSQEFLQHHLRNKLLASFDAEAQERLLACARVVEVRRGDILAAVGERPSNVHFPLLGTMLSLVVSNGDGVGIEVGMTGSEGMAGISAVLGDSPAPFQAVAQIAGQTLRLRSEILQQEFERSERVRTQILRFARFLLVQTSQTALCNRLHAVDERLARWLLMCQDRAHSETLHLTHELFAQMLGARRSTVSQSASMLQSAGLIRYIHGKVFVLDRRGLEAAACDCYRVITEEAAKLDEQSVLSGS